MLTYVNTHILLTTFILSNDNSLGTVLDFLKKKREKNRRHPSPLSTSLLSAMHEGGIRQQPPLTMSSPPPPWEEMGRGIFSVMRIRFPIGRERKCVYLARSPVRVQSRGPEPQTVQLSSKPSLSLPPSTPILSPLPQLPFFPSLSPYLQPKYEDWGVGGGEGRTVIKRGSNTAPCLPLSFKF